MSALMRAHDWASTSLGPPETWPEGLKVPLRMMLTSRFEMWLGWGEDLSFFYNDAYRPTLGAKHPQALGRPMAEVWREVFEAVRDRIETVMQQGRATWDEALMLLLERNGYVEESYHTFSYSPLRGDSGAVEGLMCVVREETERVLSERRLELLRTLAASLLPVRTFDDLTAAVGQALAADGRDFPFSELCLFDHPGPCTTAWPLAEIEAGAPSLRIPLQGLMDGPPTGAWSVPPREALIVPVLSGAARTACGALVLGINPYRPHDADLIGFAQLVAGQIAAAFGAVEARQRDADEMGRLRQLFEQSPSFMAVLRGPEHRFELVNARYLQVVGHRDLIGLPAREALPEIDGQGFFELLDRVYATGEPYVGQSVFIALQPTPDVEPQARFLDFVYQPIRDPDGEVAGIFVEGVDVTDKNEATVALRASEAQARASAEALAELNATLEVQVEARTRERDTLWAMSHDLFVIVGSDGLFKRANPAWTGQFGPLAAPPGQTRFIDFIHPDDRAKAALFYRALQEDADAGPLEVRMLATDGGYRMVSWSVSVADGDIYATGRDVTDQRRTEDALRQSQKMEAVGQLTGGLAHDFNNLLAGISGSLQMLDTRIAQGRLDAAPRYIEAAQGGAKRAAALTQRLLAFSRRQTLDPRPVNANRLIGEMEDLVRRTVGPGVQVEVVGAGGLWLTLVDPNQLENALLNLAINARDAMPDGGRITIETANKWLDDRAAKDRELPPGQYVSLCVSDTGTGMTAEVKARAFDPFFTTKPLGAGTGLGLSMIYGFVRQSGGQVRIYSELGQGTTMCLYLPRYMGEDDDGGSDAPPVHATYGGHGETVLVIDDEAVIRMLIVDVLEGAGYNAIEAPDGAAGLKVLQSDARVDLLITDVGLPGGMNGRQVADAGRVLRPGLKVLFITGYAENAVVTNGHLDPGMQVITKPFAIDALGEKIRQMIDG